VEVKMKISTITPEDFLRGVGLTPAQREALDRKIAEQKAAQEEARALVRKYGVSHVRVTLALDTRLSIEELDDSLNGRTNATLEEWDVLVDDCTPSSGYHVHYAVTHDSPLTYVVTPIVIDDAGVEHELTALAFNSEHS
jgi:hypothetical protein